MGRTKQLLPWPAEAGAGTVVSSAFDAVCPVCRDMVVVVGHESDAVVEALGDRSFHVVLADADAAMFESVRVGLEAAHRVGPMAGILLHLADHPEVGPTTLPSLLAARVRHPGLVLIPQFQGRGGHPVLIPAGAIPWLLAYSGDGGLRRYWADHPDLCHRVAVDDAGVIRDLDTPEDYAAR